MPTVLIDLPNDLAERLMSLPEQERSGFATAVVRAGINAVDGGNRSTPFLPEPGFAAVFRQAREAQGDFRGGWEVYQEKLAQEESANGNHDELVFTSGVNK